ncbi:MAG: hypothetical protein K2L02_01235 [Clostridia bacterium]|nr:hypothetical protein [Clostridia bacterium]
MKKFKISVALFVLICLPAFLLSGCKGFEGYEGEYPQLYTEAIYSILDVRGYHDSHSLVDPYIKIVETDEYGRIMYTYQEIGEYALCIMQKSDEDYVYYYPDFNFIRTSKDVWAEDINERIRNSFSEESIHELKAMNDFGKELDESKCIKKPITLKKESPELSKETVNKLEALCISFAEESGCKGKGSVYRYAQFCSYDNYGRMLFYVYGIHRDVYFDLAIIFNPDWSYDETNSLLRLTENYQSDLKEFKQLHNWDQPLK